MRQELLQTCHLPLRFNIDQSSQGKDSLPDDMGKASNANYIVRVHDKRFVDTNKFSAQKA